MAKSLFRSIGKNGRCFRSASLLCNLHPHSTITKMFLMAINLQFIFNKRSYSYNVLVLVIESHGVFNLKRESLRFLVNCFENMYRNPKALTGKLHKVCNTIWINRAGEKLDRNAGIRNWIYIPEHR